MGANPQPQEVGPVYDLLLQTRDGRPLTVLNSQRTPVQVSRVAYMTTIDRNQQQHEETELQHKDQLVQLASSNLIDREFDQWPQVSQGNWSGGSLQRVLTGSTPLTSFAAQSDPTRYWDGTGILYPTTDTVPQTPFAPPPYSDFPAQPNKFKVNNGVGAVAGHCLNTGDTFAMVYVNIANNDNILVFVNCFDGTRTVLTNPPGLGNNLVIFDMFFAFDHLWIITGNQILFADPSGSTTIFDTLPGGSTAQYMASSAGWAGNQAYLAVTYKDTNNGLHIRLYNITNSAANSFTDLPLPTGNTGVNLGFLTTVRQTLFDSGTLFISISTGDDAMIVAYSIASTIFTTAAYFHGEVNAYMAKTAVGIFIVTTAQPNLYILTGGSIQEIGPLFVQQPTSAIGFASDVMFPVGMGSYAFLPVLFNFGGDSATTVYVYAYDVERGRLFKGPAMGPFNRSIAFTMGGAKCSVSSITRVFPPAGPAVLTAPFNGPLVRTWALLTMGVLGDGIDPGDIFNFQEMWIGTALASGAPIPRGTQITSSIIDFTSAQPKLYRQAVATFTSLVNNPSVSVTLDVWLNQDPDKLSPTPDATASIDGTGRLVTNGVVTQVATGAASLVTPINAIAIKAVYRITVTGGTVNANGAVIAAPSLSAVTIRAATGWVQTLMLNLAPQVQSNGKNVQDVWTYQGIDAVAAYNFLRQLWRLSGGACLASFPNGDSGPWLIQDMHFNSPKPFGASFRADQPSTLKYIATVKIREDVA